MKLLVLVPSEEYKQNAGARIRYGRVTPELARAGIELSLTTVDAFDPEADYDVLLISKCHDGRSLLAAAIASERGKLVGVDLFDDYFSDPADSRLTWYRSWLAQLVGMCSFALCSTEAMAAVVGAYRSDLPTHVMNDPAPDHDPQAIPALVSRKLARAQASHRIEVAWFGVGDNRYFPVGLRDLAAFGSTLQRLRGDGMDVALTVLTNRRALSADGLALIAQLPVRVEIRTWSEQAEQDVLGQALVAFLPVSAQPFSRAKSLNRAFTALSSGCQVLSAGYPLYAALDPLIYRDAAQLVEDIRLGSLRLSAAGLPVYLQRLDALASAEIEAGRLAGFLDSLRRPVETEVGLLSVVHGRSTHAEVHRKAQELNALSVASPFCAAKLDFDVMFRSRGTRVDMLVSREAASRLGPGARLLLKNGERFGGREYLLLRGPACPSTSPGNEGAAIDPPSQLQLAIYGHVMQTMKEAIEEAFGPGKVILSETLQSPFPAWGWGR